MMINGNVFVIYLPQIILSLKESSVVKENTGQVYIYNENIFYRILLNLRAALLQTSLNQNLAREDSQLK